MYDIQFPKETIIVVVVVVAFVVIIENGVPVCQTRKQPLRSH